MEIAVRKATRLEYRPPKLKHVRTLVNLTFHKPALIDEMLVSLARRGRENSWIIIFKVLIIVHTLIRQGNGDQTIARLEKHPDALSIHRLKEKASAYASIQNLHLYHQYLFEKMDLYRECGIDYIKSSAKHETGHLRHLPVAQGLLRETRVVQQQIASCLSCKFQMDIGDNAISLTAYRLVVEDLLDLCQVVNEAVVNILERYFTMSKIDATNALEIYKLFADQMDHVSSYLGSARKLEKELEISIPKLNHAPVSLVSTLEDYLNEDNYEERRRSLIVEQKRGSIAGAAPETSMSTDVSIAPPASTPVPPSAVPTLVVPQSTGNPFLQLQQQQQQQQSLTLYQQPYSTGMQYPMVTGTLQPPPMHHHHPIFPVNNTLKRSASVSNNLLMPNRFASPADSVSTRASTLIMPQSTGTAATNPFRYSTQPFANTPTQNLHYKIPINTRNPFATAANAPATTTTTVANVQRHSTNPFAV
ncbi:ANTH domain-containing protein [Gongronella butleri]|nr:ANTH domain-containing protein [Gongronella butleri]